MSSNWDLVIDRYQELIEASLSPNEALQVMYLALSAAMNHGIQPPAVVPPAYAGAGSVDGVNAPSTQDTSERPQPTLEWRVEAVEVLVERLSERESERDERVRSLEGELQEVKGRLEHVRLMNRSLMDRVVTLETELDGDGAQPAPAADVMPPRAPQRRERGGAPKRGKATARLTTDERRQMRALLDDGVPMAEVARQLGIANATVCRYRDKWRAEAALAEASA